jgi:hypothetical protein
LQVSLHAGRLTPVPLPDTTATRHRRTQSDAYSLVGVIAHDVFTPILA